MLVRTRFAPSPTGGLHIGGVRTALFCYLYAKKHGGQFILRLEDTDQNRFVEGSEAYIVENLLWCGIIPDESPQLGGQYAPYRQSERKAVGIYQQYADQLIADGNAYYAFDTPEELDAIRKEYEQAGKRFQYDAHTRQLPILKNSLTLAPEEVARRRAANETCVVRIKMPLNETIVFDDLIRGRVEFKSDLTDDKILLKADAMPTYHLAVVIDDYLMKITHAFRGEEWLPSAPVHLKLYDYLGLKDQMPRFAHLPLILKPDGKGKLSKRDGDRLGFPVYALSWLNRETGMPTLGFREQGFLPQAVVNFLALLGWNSGTEQEIFSMNELIEKFDIERVNKAGAKFDYEKAKWFNQQYIKAMPNHELAAQLWELAPPTDQPFTLNYLEQATAMMKDRLVFIADFWREALYLFQAPAQYDQATIQKKWKPEFATTFAHLAAQLQTVPDFSAGNIEQFLKQYTHDNNLKAGDIMPLLRVFLTGSMGGPAIPDLMALLGKQETEHRIKRAIDIAQK
jgi:glutamyl-tRNA synthetase